MAGYGRARYLRRWPQNAAAQEFNSTSETDQRRLPASVPDAATAGRVVAAGGHQSSLVWLFRELWQGLFGTAALAAGLTFSSPPVSGQTTPLDSGPFPPLRFEQTCRTLAELRKLTGIPTEYISLGEGADYCISFGGEIKERYEHFTNENFGKIGVAQENYLLSRIRFGTDLHLGEHVRTFIQFSRHDEVNKILLGPPDEDGFDLHQGFLDLSSATDFATNITLRVGRQEMLLGAGRFVGPRERQNVRRSFNGLRSYAVWNNGARLDAFVVRPTLLRLGNFDDRPDRHQQLVGLYGTLPLDPAKNFNVDAYYYLLLAKGPPFTSGQTMERRHTVGTRIWGGVDPWDYDADILFQFGTQGQSEIRAGGIAARVGYSFPNGSEWWRPRFVLEAGYFSGNEDVTRRKVNTFNPLFGRGGPIFSDAGLVDSVNLIDVYPSLKLHPMRTVAIQFGPVVNWRASTRDAVYLSGGVPVPGSAQSGGSYVGTNFMLQASWTATPTLSLYATLAHAMAGPAITNVHGKDVDYGTFVIRLNF